MNNSYTANRNARIITRTDRTGKSRTETDRRDSGFDFAVTTDSRKNSTNLFIDVGHSGQAFRLSGRDARTLYRLLSKHYDVNGKPL